MQNSEISHFRVMGILNITPDSFSDGGEYFDSTAVRIRAETLEVDGADIIDIGAESTGPGSAPVSAAEELRRLRLFFEASGKKPGSTPKISVDTYKSQVAAWCLEQKGVAIINDVSGLRADPEMVHVVSSSSAKIVIMYGKEAGLPHVTSSERRYESVVDEISSFLEDRILCATQNGVSESQIILDPGMGAFLSLDSSRSWDVVKSFSALKERFRGFPWLVGVSRKSFVRKSMQGENLDFASKLVEYELYRKGVDIIRTHNVRMFKEYVGVIQEMVA